MAYEALLYEVSDDGVARISMNLPDTRNALKIPELKNPELPREPGTCLEHPPPYGDARAEPASA